MTTDWQPGERVASRYTVVRKLGQGSLGRAFEVRDERQGGRSLALKVIRAEVMSPGAARLLRREFRILSRLRHPHIVRVEEFGRLVGRRELYFTERLVDGFHFVKVLRRAPFSVFLDSFAQACRALGHIHARGVLHGDIKSRNLLIGARRDGSLRLQLIDFHLAREGASFRDGILRGTVGTMAPEMIRGDEVDHRADLYALGVVAYEALARRSPFRGSAEEVLRAHVHEAPPDLRERRPDIPEGLARQLMRLLAKDPSDRPQSARELLRALREEGAPELRVETHSTRLASLQSGRLIGREALVDRARGAIAALAPEVELGRAVESRLLVSVETGEALPQRTGEAPDNTGPQPLPAPAVCVLVGAPELGSAEVLAAIRTEAQLAGLSSCAVRAGLAGSRPLGPLLAIARAHIEHLHLDELLAEVAPQGLIDPQRLLQRHLAQGGDGGVAQAVARLLETLSEARPFVATIEDGDALDAGSREVLGLLSERQPRLWLVLDSAEGLTPPGGLESWPLRRLSKEELLRRLEAMLGERVDAGFAQRVFEVTGGNPAFAEATVQLMVEEGELLRPDGSLSATLAGITDVPAPGSVLEALRRRVRRWEPPVREALAVAALSLRPRPLAFFTATLRGDRAALEDIFARLESEGWVESVMSAGLRLLWVPQRPLRGLAVSEASAEARREWHGRMAQLIESRHPAASGFWSLQGAAEWMIDRAEELALHLVEAGRPEDALALAFELAEGGSGRSHRIRARRLYAWVTELSSERGGPCAELTQARLWQRAIALSRLGRLDDARSAWEAFIVHGEIDAPALMELYRGRVELETGQLDEAEAALRRGLESCPEGDGVLRGRLELSLAAAALWRGRIAEAAALAGRAESALHAVSFAAEREEAALLAAIARRWSGGPAEARPRADGLSWFEVLPFGDGEWLEPWDEEALRAQVALDIAEGERLDAARGALLCGRLARAAGDWQRALEDFERAVMLAEDESADLGASIGRWAIGALLIEIGDSENGEASVELAESWAEELGCAWLSGYARLALGRSRQLRGEDLHADPALAAAHPWLAAEVALSDLEAGSEPDLDEAFSTWAAARPRAHEGQRWRGACIAWARGLAEAPLEGAAATFEARCQLAEASLTRALREGDEANTERARGRLKGLWAELRSRLTPALAKEHRALQRRAEKGGAAHAG